MQTVRKLFTDIKIVDVTFLGKMSGGNFKCSRCKLVCRDNHDLQKHLDRKKKCIAIDEVSTTPPSSRKFFCEPCKQAFSTKGNYLSHLKTRSHERMTGGDNVSATTTTINSNNTIDNSTNHTVNNTSNTINIQFNLTPRDINGMDYNYLADMTAIELKKELGLDAANMQETIVNTVRALHTANERPQNHNILLESPNALKAMIYKADSWRLEDRTRTLNDCICQSAVHLLELEDILKDCMNEKDFKTFSMYRDDMERESARESNDSRLQSLMDRVADVLSEFTKDRPQVVEHAKKCAESAAPLKYRLSQRFQAWLPGGRSYEDAWDNLLSSTG